MVLCMYNVSEVSRMGNQTCLKEIVMKKAYLLGGVALIMLTLMGCPGETDDSLPKQDGAKLPTGWAGLDLLVLTGANPSEITYTFTPTIPPAASYKVWYIAGRKTSADEIIDKPEAFSRDHTDAAITGTTISVPVPGAEYTFVVVAVSGTQTGYSAVRSAKSKAAPQNGFTLTVTDLPPSTAGIYGASLMDPADPGTPIAIGTGSNGKFTFYHSKEGTFPIDLNRPFVTPGIYTLAVALTDISFNPLKIYTYKETITYSTTSTSVTVFWRDFSEMGGEQSSANSVITIANKPSNVNILAVMSDNNTVQVAIGMNLTGGNTFALYEPGTLGPDTSKPWKGSGSYSILLLNMTAPTTPVATYMKIEGETQNPLYAFTGQEAISLDYNTDFVPVQ